MGIKANNYLNETNTMMPNIQYSHWQHLKAQHFLYKNCKNVCTAVKVRNL